MGLSQQQGRGSGIDAMTDCDHMLVFAFATRVSSNGAGIFKIDLDLFEGFSWQQGASFALRWIQNTSRFAQDLPDGARGTWHANAQSLQGSIALQEIQDGFRSRNTLQVVRWLFTYLENTINQMRMWWRRGRMTSARVRMQDLQIIGSG